MNENLAITCLEPFHYQHAVRLAEQLNLPFIAYEQREQYTALLIYTEKALQLQLPQCPQFSPLYVDFIHGKIAHRCLYGGGRQQSIARAVGLHKHKHVSVLDVTAGLGGDAYVLAHLGAAVTMLERNPLIGALLTDGLQRAHTHISNLQLQLKLVITDAQHYLEDLQLSQQPEVIYLDPMFPASQNTALAKKAMRILRQIVGDDEDADRLLKLALQKAQSRVVVKRPRLAPCIAGKQPSFNIIGKSNRFDIYLTN